MEAQSFMILFWDYKLFLGVRPNVLVHDESKLFIVKYIKTMGCTSQLSNRTNNLGTYYLLINIR